jgi:S-DNA-T family DNA segregation ATPase FtsK/SpoIIIE
MKDASPPRQATPLGLSALLLGAALLALVATALLSHDGRDAAFSIATERTLPLNRLGVFGAWLSDLLYFGFGFSAWWLWLVGLRRWLGALAGLWREQDRPAPPGWQLPAGLLLLLLASCALEWTRLYALESRLPGHAGGVLGYSLGPIAMQLLGFAGSGLLAILLLLLGLAWAMGFSWLQVSERLGGWLETRWSARQQRREAREDERLGQQAQEEREVEVQEAKVEREVEAEQHEPLYVEPPVLNVPVDLPSSTRVAAERELADTKLPQVDLLDAAGHAHRNGDARVAGDDQPPDREEAQGLRRRGARGGGLARPGDHALRDRARHRREGRADRQPGQGPGAFAVAGEHPRGRDHPGQELHGAGTAQRAAPDHPPVRDPGLAGLQRRASMLTMGLGKDIVGNPVVADLAKMPHCLVAGTTGSGKSVGINAMILSLLYKAEARDVRLILIDPKMLEMSVYEGIPHLLAPVVTDMKQAANALNWCVGEMERRYKLMSKLGVRNLAGYNKKIADAKASAAS